MGEALPGQESADLQVGVDRRQTRLSQLRVDHRHDLRRELLPTCQHGLSVSGAALGRGGDDRAIGRGADDRATMEQV